MDRHQFVKELIAERDTLNAERKNLRLKIEQARQRTKEAVLDFPKQGTIATCSNGFATFACSSQSDVSYSDIVPEQERVSDDAIRALCIEIYQLQEGNKTLEGELSELKGQDFVSHLQKLISLK